MLALCNLVEERAILKFVVILHAVDPLKRKINHVNSCKTVNAEFITDSVFWSWTFMIHQIHNMRQQYL